MQPIDVRGKPIAPLSETRRRKRPAGERRTKEDVWLKVRMDPASYALLRVAAAQRGVKVTPLVNDVLNMWMHHAIDMRQEVLREASGGRGPAPVPERWAGYHASLGYAPTESVPEPRATRFPLDPTDPEERAPRYETPVPERLKQIVATEEAITHVRIARDQQASDDADQSFIPREPNPAPMFPMGTGNAAQQWEMGMPELPDAADYLPSHGRDRIE